MEPQVSVVIPTRDRVGETAACLERVRSSVRAAGIPAEVLVVDDGSRDATPRMVRRKAREWGKALPLRLVRFERSSGPAHARNAGVRHARAPLIAFTDSDCLPSRGWIGAFLRSASDHPKTALFEGPVVPPTRVRPGIYDHAVDNRRGGQGLTSNLCVRSSVFRMLNGLDERYDHPHCREDTDFYFKVIGRGLGTRFVPAAQVLHPVKPGRPGAFLRSSMLGIHEGLLFLRHPRLYLTRLKWVDGWAVPAYYLGFYAAAAGGARMWLGMAPPTRPMAGIAAAFFVASLAATIYARMRGRRGGGLSAVPALALEETITPFARLFWVALGMLRAAGIYAAGRLFRDRNRGLGR